MHACVLPKMSLPITSAKAPCSACTPASRPSRMRLRAIRTASQPLRSVTPLLVLAWLGSGVGLGLGLGLELGLGLGLELGLGGWCGILRLALSVGLEFVVLRIDASILVDQHAALPPAVQPITPQSECAAAQRRRGVRAVVVQIVAAQRAARRLVRF